MKTSTTLWYAVSLLQALCILFGMAVVGVPLHEERLPGWLPCFLRPPVGDLAAFVLAVMCTLIREGKWAAKIGEALVKWQAAELALLVGVPFVEEAHVYHTAAINLLKYLGLAMMDLLCDAFNMIFARCHAHVEVAAEDADVPTAIVVVAHDPSHTDVADKDSDEPTAVLVANAATDPPPTTSTTTDELLSGL